MRPDRRCPILVPLAVALFSVPVSAAAPQLYQEVPSDLLRALLTTRDRGLDLFVGPPPVGAASSVPLRNGDTPLGGIQGTSDAVLVFEVVTEPLVALSEYGQYLVSTGWEPGPDRRDPRGGFVYSPRSVTGVWCTRSQTLQSTGLSFESRNYLRVRVSGREGDSSVCDALPAQQMMLQMYRLRFPTLSPPSGAVVSGGGGGGSSDALNSDVTVDTEMGPAQLFEHYSEQLGDAGWVPRGTASSEDISIGRWDALDEDGEPVMGILGVWRSAVPGVHRAWIRMEREPRRR